MGSASGRELAVMKTITIVIVLMLAPEFAAALELSPKGDAPSGMPAAIPGPLAARSQNAATTAPVDNFPIELNALRIGPDFTTSPDPAWETKQSDSMERGIIEDWRDQMFKTISMYFGPRQQDPAQTNRLLTNGQQADDGKIVMKLVLKETLKFTKERVVWIDSLVKAMKYEVSSDKLGRENVEAAAKNALTGDNKSNDHKPGDARPAKNAVVKDKLIVKTGLRVRIDGGRLGLVSESEAGYGKASYFYKVNLDNQGDNSLGFRYVLGRSVYIQVERDFIRTMDPTAHDKPNINLVQLGYRF